MAKKAVKCPICNRKYVNIEGLSNHIEEVHGESIPKHMESGAQYYYFLRTGKSEGKCVECGKPTKWNPKTNKYSRFCGNPKCKQAARDRYLKNMIGKYNKTTLLDDPEHQRKMLKGRSISGDYTFKDGTKIGYVGSYEKDFLQFLDVVFEWDPADIMAPAPKTYYYDYKGEKHFYIPDMYIPSLDLNIEIKDGGNNPNKHHKIQEVDKVKERMKDEMMCTLNSSYVKLYNKNYGNFMLFLNKRKEEYIAGEKPRPIYLIEDPGKKKVVQEVATTADAVSVLGKIVGYNKAMRSDYPYHYDATKKYLDNELRHINSARDLHIVNSAVIDIEKKVKRDIAKKGEEGQAYKYEGEKILDYLNNYVKPHLKSQELRFKKLTKESTEENSPIIYDESNFDRINELTCPKGFYSLEENGVTRWNAVKWINGEPWRDCVETLVFKGPNKIFLYYDGKFYITPGGSKDITVPDIVQARKEVNEEAFIELAHIEGPVHRDSYEFSSKREGKFNYKGRTVELYIGKYKEPYAGRIAKADIHENMKKKGKFYNIDDIYDDLKPAFQKVIDIYRGVDNRPVLESSKKIKEDNYILIPLFSNQAVSSNIIKRVTGQPYSHAAVTLDTSMNKCYSFSSIPFDRRSNTNGFVRESIYSPTHLHNEFFDVFMMPVTTKAKEHVERIIKKLLREGARYKYNSIGLIQYYLNMKYVGKLDLKHKTKYFCSEFVSYIINETKKEPKANVYVSPGDLSNFPDVHFVGRYTIDSFKQANLDRDLNRVMQKLGIITEGFLEELPIPEVNITWLHQRDANKWKVEEVIGQFTFKLDWLRLKNGLEEIFGEGLNKLSRFAIIEHSIRKFIIPKYGNRLDPNKPLKFNEDIVTEEIIGIIEKNKTRYIEAMESKGFITTLRIDF